MHVTVSILLNQKLKSSVQTNIYCLRLLLLLCSTSTSSYFCPFQQTHLSFLFSASLWPLTFFPSRCCRWFWAMMRNVSCCSLLFNLGRVSPKKCWDTMRSTALTSNGKVGPRTAALAQQQLCSRPSACWVDSCPCHLQTWMMARTTNSLQTQKRRLI